MADPNMASSYKYHCRECPPPIRRRCIQEARISPGIKRIIERSFENRTDTQNTWDFLQPNCLLFQREDLVRQLAPTEEGGLLSRIHRQREKELAQASEAQETGPDAALLLDTESRREADLRTKLFVTRMLSEPPDARIPVPPPSLDSTLTMPQSRNTAPLSWSPPTRVSPAKSAAVQSVQYPPALRPKATESEAPGPRMLVVQGSGHRISLPEDGELVLGRFDPLTRVTPDVDLTFDNQRGRGVSRRHARITGWRGQYAITDLGSRNGTWVNGEHLSLTDRRLLLVGDVVRLGGCVMFFDQVPELWHRDFPSGQYFLFVAYTGTYAPLAPQQRLIVGRSDPTLGFKPDIDLSGEGRVASVVSRRHIRLIQDRDRFLIEDLGSANKTRIDGQPVPIGKQTPIEPGQHLWLGGCILAFDVVELPDTTAEGRRE